MTEGVYIHFAGTILDIRDYEADFQLVADYPHTEMIWEKDGELRVIPRVIVENLYRVYSEYKKQPDFQVLIGMWDAMFGIHRSETEPLPEVNVSLDVVPKCGHSGSNCYCNHAPPQ